MSNIVRFPNRPTLKTFAEDLDVSEPTKTALFNYLNKRQCPGNFLTAVLTNNLIEAVQYADEKNTTSLPNLVKWLYQNAPMACWGSDEAVEKWLNQ